MEQLSLDARHSTSVTNTKARRVAWPLNTPRKLIWDLLRPDIRHIFREGVFLVLAESPRRLEMVVVNKSISGVMHVAVVGALQIGDAHQLESQRFRFWRIRSSHRRLIAGHAIVGQLHVAAVEIVQ